MGKNFLQILIFLLSQACYSQSGALLRVLDQAGSPIDLVHVIHQDRLIAITNADGEVLLSNDIKKVRLSHITFETTEIQIDSSVVTVRMKEAVYEHEIIFDNDSLHDLIRVLYKNSFLNRSLEDEKLVFQRYEYKNDTLYYFREQKYVHIIKPSELISDSAIFVQKVADYDKIWSKVSISVSLSSTKGLDNYLKNFLSPENTREDISFSHLGQDLDNGYIMFHIPQYNKQGLIKYSLSDLLILEFSITTIRQIDAPNHPLMKIIGGFKIMEVKDYYSRVGYFYEGEKRKVKFSEDYYSFKVKKKGKVANLSYKGLIINDRIYPMILKKDLTKYGGYFYSRIR